MIDNIHNDENNFDKKAFIVSLNDILYNKEKYKKTLKKISDFYNEPISKFSFDIQNNQVFLYRKYFFFFYRKSTINFKTLFKIIKHTHS